MSMAAELEKMCKGPWRGRPMFPGLTIKYELWRFLYWQMQHKLSYDQIDAAVASGELVPNDDQVTLEGDEE